MSLERIGDLEMPGVHIEDEITFPVFFELSRQQENNRCRGVKSDEISEKLDYQQKHRMLLSKQLLIHYPEFFWSSTLL